MTCRLHALLAEIKDLLGAVLVSQNDGQNGSNLLGKQVQQLQSTACSSQLPANSHEQLCSQTHEASAASAVQELQQQVACLAADSNCSGSCQEQQLLTLCRPKPVVQLEVPLGEATAAATQTTASAAEAAAEPVGACAHCHCTDSTHQQSAGAQAAAPQLMQQQEQQAQHQQQLLPSPLMLSTKLFKPCLADVVMHVRAANQAQVRQQQRLADTTCCFPARL